jgi:hypothetical protein
MRMWTSRDACSASSYCLLRKSRRFSDFVVTRTDIDTLVCSVWCVTVRSCADGAQVLPLLFSVYCDARDIEHLHM